MWQSKKVKQKIVKIIKTEAFKNKHYKLIFALGNHELEAMIKTINSDSVTGGN